MVSFNKILCLYSMYNIVSSEHPSIVVSNEQLTEEGDLKLCSRVHLNH